MKKAIILAIVGLAAGLTTSSHGQGAIRLDNYDTTGPFVTYGAGSDGSLNTGLSSAYTMAFYYWNAVGSFTGSTSADATGIADPTTLGSYLLATGVGSSAAFGYGGQPGAARAGSAWVVPIAPSPTGGSTITLMVVAYEGASYATATYRGHSAAFTLVTSDTTSPSPVQTSSVMQGFSVFQAVPEPTTMALGGLGLAALLVARRKKA